VCCTVVTASRYIIIIYLLPLSLRKSTYFVSFFIFRIFYYVIKMPLFFFAWNILRTLLHPFVILSALSFFVGPTCKLYMVHCSKLSHGVSECIYSILVQFSLRVQLCGTETSTCFSSFFETFLPVSPNLPAPISHSIPGHRRSPTHNIFSTSNTELPCSFKKPR
jgi:hypothetical protein